MSRSRRAVSRGGAGDIDSLAQRIEKTSRGLGIAPGGARRLAIHLDLLFAWSSRYNLTAIRSLDEALERHVAESLAVLPELRPGPTDCLVDVGSGAGYPGLALLCATEQCTGILVEARDAKVAFLRAVIRETGLADRVAVLARRLAGPEEIPAEATVVTLRAVADPASWVTGALRGSRVRAVAAWVGEPILDALSSQLKVGAQTFSTVALPGRSAAFAVVARPA